MAKNNKNNYIRTDKVYDIMGLGNTNLVGWKLTGDNSLHKDKNSYHITMRTKPFVFKEIGVIRSYQAYEQFSDICENAPQTLTKGKCTLSANGTIPKALLDILGTNEVANEIKGVRTLEEVGATMDSWSTKKK